MSLLPIKMKLVRSAFVFLLTAMIGLWFAGAFEGYIIRFYIQQTFTVAEAEKLLDKEVVLTYKPVNGTRGKVVSVYSAPDGLVFLRVNFPSFQDKTDQTIGYCKNSFRTGHIVVVE
jgi:hypothetical protein